jgi:hypothetical protein
VIKKRKRAGPSKTGGACAWAQHDHAAELSANHGQKCAQNPTFLYPCSLLCRDPLGTVFGNTRKQERVRCSSLVGRPVYPRLRAIMQVRELPQLGRLIELNLPIKTGG